MANLIVTIISIALVAVTAVMAVWYGSSAYSQWTLRGNALAAIQQSEQIVAAYLLYRTTNAPPATTFAVNGSDVLSTGGYLQQSWVPPVYPFRSPGDNNFNVVGLSYYSGLYTTLSSSILRVINVDPDVCGEINRVTTGSSELGKTGNSGDNNSASWTAAVDSNGLTKLNRLEKWGLDCYYFDANTNGQRDSDEPVRFHRLIEK